MEKKKRIREPQTELSEKSLELDDFGLGLLEDGDVRVGIFPEREEIFVGGECADAGSIRIRALRCPGLQSARTSHSQARQRSRPAVPHDPAVIENLLKFGGGSAVLSLLKAPIRA